MADALKGHCVAAMNLAGLLVSNTLRGRQDDGVGVQQHQPQPVRASRTSTHPLNPLLPP